MESRNLVTAREMLQKGNWLEPTMNGEPRFEKPPLPTWISAMMIAVFGQDNMALLRLPAVISGMLLIFFLYMLTREMTGDEDLPFLTAGTAASSFYILFMARDISWDIFCHSFMLGSIWLIHKNLKRQDQFAGYIGAGLLMGLSALSKGPIAFYALLLPYLLARGLVYGYNLSLSQIKGLALMTVIMLVLALWWPIYIYFSNPGHSWFVAQKESSAWLNRSSYPFYHYWSFPVQSGVWTIIAVAALVFPYAQKRLNKILNYKLIATWVWFSVLLLSLFPEKKERYLFPVMIPLAILTAAWFRYIIKALDLKTATRSDLFLLRLNSIVLSLICVIIPNGIFLISKGKQEPGKVMLFFITILLLFFAFLFIRTEIRKKPFLIWAGMTGLMMMTGLLIPAMSKVFQSNSSYHSYHELRHKKNLTDLPFFFNGVIEGKFIEVIWSSGHEIHYWNPLEKDLPVNPPFVFISHEQPYIILPPKILTNYNVRLIGHYDKNLQEERSQAVLSNYVSVIEPLNK
jgi:4-amino-4-deoxy-L-arabinose transferase-like glycosyltransferase